MLKLCYKTYRHVNTTITCVLCKFWNKEDERCTYTDDREEDNNIKNQCKHEWIQVDKEIYITEDGFVAKRLIDACEKCGKRRK